MVTAQELEALIERSKRDKELKDIKREKNKAYREKYPEKYREAQKRWRDNNRDKILAYQKEYRLNFKKRFRETIELNQQKVIWL